MYREINCGCDYKRPVTAKMSISNISTQDWSNPNSANPVGDIVGRGDRALMELICQIYDEIGGYAIIGHTFKNLVDCTSQKKKKWTKKRGHQWLLQTDLNDKCKLIGMF